MKDIDAFFYRASILLVIVIIATIIKVWSI